MTNILQHDFILLDRSGSMQGNMWIEALNSINAYVKKLADDNVDTGVTLAVFDSNEPFKIIRDRVIPKSWKVVTNEDASPRGGTPLYDATAELVHLANRGAPWGEQYKRVAIVVMTDGEENSSQRYRNAQVKSLLDECRAKDWQVVFLGANFDNDHQSSSLGGNFGTTVRSSTTNLGVSMRSMGMKRASYSATGASMSYGAAEKTALASEKPVTDEQLADLANGGSGTGV